MARKSRPPGKPPKKPVANKSTLPISYHYCRRCRRERIFVNGRCSACA